MSKSSSLSPDNILRFLQVRNESVTTTEIVQGLHLSKSERKPLFKMLSKLKKRSLIAEVAPGKYKLRGKKFESESGTKRPADSAPTARRLPGNSVSGRLVLHQDGYGFVIPDQPIPN